MRYCLQDRTCQHNLGLATSHQFWLEGDFHLDGQNSFRPSLEKKTESHADSLIRLPTVVAQFLICQTTHKDECA